MPHRIFNRSGFTLIEVIIVVVIGAILASVALRSAITLSDTAKVEETKQELQALAFSMVGNPALANNSVRSDFGYVGDVGALPPDLDALKSNPGGYSTWNGPYIVDEFTQKVDDYKTDAWGVNYDYAGVNITSSGSGSDIVRTLGKSVNDFTFNQVRGVVSDRDGTPPGPTYMDSVEVTLTIPNGTGGMVGKVSTVDVGGYFSFDSVPVGNHDIQIVYMPNDDSLTRFVSVLPASSPYGEYGLPSDVWAVSGAGGSGLESMAGRDSVYTTPQCNNFSFWVINNSGSLVSVNSITLTYATPTAYYRYVRWNGTTVFDSNNPKAGSGELASFSVGQAVADGDSARVQIETFEANPVGGANVDMSNVSVTVLLSDGSTFAISFGACQ
ncbi:MAG: prepilin-type N-terminal cleavage/methylation domain-containing protein [candidate division Zixibacteria bacterium]|nr:prepilin-type N-terminal cleavage/methylation domain-containing protein [candidate division Zixibacteria bacterium]MDH3936209.1 prepilin-type N-terminal cleavage/methylation domain-containing protein [candidate division Zixibacteria bacterium]MDH4033592.1 prepilin-type N-terminal cleavage/methylation domain-containing protein [candidate division Zixibacteria bacterium]